MTSGTFDRHGYLRPDALVCPEPQDNPALSTWDAVQYLAKGGTVHRAVLKRLSRAGYWQGSLDSGSLSESGRRFAASLANVEAKKARAAAKRDARTRAAFERTKGYKD